MTTKLSTNLISFDPSADEDEVEFRPIELKAPGIIERRSVYESVETGVMAVDALIPIGRGQRELIIGDRQTGKTAVAIDAILNQKYLNASAALDEEEDFSEYLFCVYVAIGQKQSSMNILIDKLYQFGAMDYTTIVFTSSADSATLQFFAPYSGCTIGE